MLQQLHSAKMAVNPDLHPNPGLYHNRANTNTNPNLNPNLKPHL